MAEQFLSTPSARRATVPLSQLPHAWGISIHALREEGDRPLSGVASKVCYFYPRPPRGGRPCTESGIGRSSPYFYPRPPRGGRRGGLPLLGKLHQFLSTPSARRATGGALQRHTRQDYFYPRPPRGGRLAAMLPPPPFFLISIHALREEGDGSAFPTTTQPEKFLSTPSARRATAKTEKNISAFVSL